MVHVAAKVCAHVSRHAARLRHDKAGYSPDRLYLSHAACADDQSDYTAAHRVDRFNSNLPLYERRYELGQQSTATEERDITDFNSVHRRAEHEPGQLDDPTIHIALGSA